jgi:ADP-ribosyl-[dinitrogen reductase] hydrolase
MALALAESLMAHTPLDPVDLGQRFAAWYRSGPSDVGIHTGSVLGRISAGEPWERAVASAQRQRPDSAGNGSVMRCWPVAVACWKDVARLLAESRLQSRVTHPHVECVEGCAFVNAAIYYLARGVLPAEAIARALSHVDLPPDAQGALKAAPSRGRDELTNSGWVRATLESAVWGLRTTNSFEEAVVQVVNLGNDADTAGAVVGALAGTAYGLEAIPQRWRRALQGEWPPKSGQCWLVGDLVALADALAKAGREQNQ